jgi:hypothetical protein
LVLADAGTATDWGVNGAIHLEMVGMVGMVGMVETVETEEAWKTLDEAQPCSASIT